MRQPVIGKPEGERHPSVTAMKPDLIIAGTGTTQYKVRTEKRGYYMTYEGLNAPYNRRITGDGEYNARREPHKTANRRICSYTGSHP